jgi:cytochrome c553
MKTSIAKGWLPFVILFMATQAQAESLIDGSIDAGTSKSITCTACHGAEGNSVNPLWPNIAGQSANYLLTQMAAFKNGTRSDPLMTPQAMLLSDEDMRDVAVYFESLPGAAMAVADTSRLDKGTALYRGGDMESGAAACLACHGPTGRGNPAANYPALQGQHATYTAKQLRDYANETRMSDGKTRIMRDIAARLSDDDINALASYVQGLRP